MSSSEVASLAGTMKPDWPGSSYHLVKKNCNCFSEALAKQLLGHSIPGWVNRMADLGAMCSCLIPDEAVGAAPVDAQAGGQPAPSPSTGRGVGGVATLGLRRSAAPAPAPAAAFKGGGARLGSTAPARSSSFISSFTSSTTSSPPSGAAEGRREAMRQAALARANGS
jgi:hypothetical protein